MFSALNYDSMLSANLLLKTLSGVLILLFHKPTEI